MKSLLARWGMNVVKFRWLIISLWLVLVIIGGMFASQVGTLLTGGGWGVPGSGSNRAYELLSEKFEARNATTLTFVMSHTEYEVGSEEYTSALKTVSEFLVKEAEIDRVYTWVDASNDMKPSFIGKDGRTSIGIVEMNIDEGFAQKVLSDMQKRLSMQLEDERFEVVLLGAPAFWAEMNALSQEGLNNAHLYAIPIILLILFLVFRSVISAITPLILAIFSIVMTLGILNFVAQWTELSLFVLDAAMMLGIGVGIDFALIYVMRFKQELEKSGGNIANALSITMKTAGHSIIFSGLTIIGSMAAILFVDIAAVRSIAVGVIVVVLLLMLTSLSLLPALLAVLGKKVNGLRIPFLSNKTKEKNQSVWYRLAHKVMKRPFIYLAGSVLVLLIIAWPSLQLAVSTPDSRMLPEETKVRQGINTLEKGFGVGYASPIHVVIESESEKMTSEKNLTEISKLLEQLQSVENVVDTSSVLSYFPDMEMGMVSTLLNENSNQLPEDSLIMINRNLSINHDVVVIDVITNDYSSSENNRQVVYKIRDIVSELEVQNSSLNIYVGGETAEGIDTSNSLNNSLLEVALYTLLLIFVVLMFTFRSLVLSLKAIIMNVLSLGATYGVLVAVFQWGWGSSIFGFGDFGFIQSFIPILLLGLLFSLSTDYEVFLLSRVQEEYMNGNSNEESLSLGLEKTAPMISGAALIMVTVFGSFAFAGVLPMQQLGLGMAVAIAIDATIVRLIIVPSAMKLLGKWNWALSFKPKEVKGDSKKM